MVCAVYFKVPAGMALLVEVSSLDDFGLNDSGRSLIFTLHKSGEKIFVAKDNVALARSLSEEELKELEEEQKKAEGDRNKKLVSPRLMIPR